LAVCLAVVAADRVGPLRERAFELSTVSSTGTAPAIPGRDRDRRTGPVESAAFECGTNGEVVSQNESAKEYVG
jgi:hypothetical protein